MGDITRFLVFGLLVPKDFYIICLSNYLIMIVLDEGHSWHVSCAPISIYILLTLCNSLSVESGFPDISFSPTILCIIRVYVVD